MKSFRCTGFLLALGIVICAILFVLQNREIAILDKQIDKQQQNIALWENKPGKRSVTASGELSAVPHDKSLDTSIHADPVTKARESIKQLTADLRGVDFSHHAFFALLPDILKTVEHLSLEQLLEVAGALDGGSLSGNLSGESEARTVLLYIIADQDASLLLQKEEHLLALGIRHFVIDALARQNPHRVEELMRTMEITDSEQHWARSQKLAGVLEQDVRSGLDLLRKLKVEEEYTFYSRPLPSEQIPALIAALDDPNNQLLRGEITEMIMKSTLKESGVAGARKLMSELEVEKTDVAEAVESLDFYESMSEEPEETLAWLEEVQSPEQLAESLPSAVSKWAFSDYNAAGEWLGAMEPSPIKDAAILSFAEAVSELDPEAATIWSATIEDEERRIEGLESALRAWQEKDSAAADQWMRDNEFDLSERTN